MNSFFAKRDWLTFSFCLFACLLIWFVGPYLAFAGHEVFKDANVRIACLTCIISSFIGFKAIAFLSQKPNLQVVSLEPLAENAAMVQQLNQRFEYAYQFLKKFPQQVIPCYLVLGPSQSGKSTLLAHTDLEFIANDKFTNSANDAFASTTCQWRLSKEAIFLDVPGHFTVSENEKSLTFLWQHLINFLAKLNNKSHLQGIILTVNLHQVMTDGQFMQPILQLKSALLALQNRLKQEIPIYLLFSQCDRVAGFIEFFDDLGPKERQQYLGFTLNPPNRKPEMTVTNIFHQEFDQFLKRLHQRLIWRLHHERNIDRRCLIKDFPIQLESLKDNMANIVYQLSDNLSCHQQCPLEGVFFASGMQKGETINRLIKSFTTVFELNPIATPSLNVINRPFFVHEFFNSVLLQRHQEKPVQTRSSRLTQFSYSLVIIPPIIAGVLWWQQYTQQKEIIFSATKAYNNYKHLTQSNLSLNQTIAALSTLSHAINNFHHYHPSLLARTMGSAKVEQALQTNAEQAYTKAVHTDLLPKVSAAIEQKLFSIDKKQTAQTYSLLKIYLMLNDLNHLDSAYLHHWFLTKGPNVLSLTPYQISELEQHLATALNPPLPKFNLNDNLIKDVRAILNAMPYPLLAYTLIKGEIIAPPMAFLQTKDSAFYQVFHLNNAQLPWNTLYTANTFAQLLQNTIPQVSKDVATGNWILGNNGATDLNSEEIKVLQQEVQDLYLDDYLMYWNQLISNVQLNEIKTLANAQKILTALTGNDSVLMQMLQLINDNTALTKLSGALPLDDQKIIMERLAKENFEAYNLLLANSAATVQPTLQALTELRDAVNNISGSAQTDEAAVILAQNYFAHSSDNPLVRLQQLASAYPEPVKSWLTTIANSTWQIILHQAHQQINSVWHNSILPIYNASLHQRYPLYRDTPFEASRFDFEAFFAPHGKLAKYFNHYLKGFIDTDKPKWQWMTLLGKKIEIADVVLEQFERASIISRMYFPEGEKMITRFFLQPVAFVPGLLSVGISHNGKQVVDTTSQSQISSWVWPDSTVSPAVAISFQNDRGETPSITKTGEWAWFHLFDQAHLTPTQDPKKFELIFDLNGNSAKYNLITNNSINPFIVGIIDQFRCPEDL